MHITENSGRREQLISGSGEPLVLLHGWAMNAEVWRPVLHQLEVNWQVYRVNLPGHGGCAYSRTAAEFDDWLERIIDIAPANAVWLGWSLGGLFSIAAAARYPERVKKLVLVATTPKFVTAVDWLFAGDVAVWRRFSESLLKNAKATNSQFLKTQALGSKKPVQICKQLKTLQDKGGIAHPQALQDGLQILQTTDLRLELSQVVCPTHWVMGDGDHLVPQEVLADIQMLQPDCATSVIQSAGHVPFLSQPEDFLRSLSLVGEAS